MPFFIKKICEVEVNNNIVTIKPRNVSLEDLCMPNGRHNCVDYRVEDIFDFRSYILNNYIQRPINFYLHLLDENKNIIPIDDLDNCYSLIYSFNRKNKKRNLNYYPFITKNKLDVFNNIIDMGYSSLITNQMVAYETISCFKSHFSKDGGGFFGFRLNIENINIRPHFAVLYGYENKIKNPNTLFNNRIMDLNSDSRYNTNRYITVSRSESSEYSSEYSSEESTEYPVYVPHNQENNIGYAMPSAPPQIIEPTAPPYPGLVETPRN